MGVASANRETYFQKNRHTPTSTIWTGNRGETKGNRGRLTKRLWNERGVCLSTKINVSCAVVLTTLLYGCEAWTPYRRHIRRLDQFHMHCLRQIAGIKCQDMVPNIEVLEQCGTSGIEFHIKRAQLRGSGHLVRMNDGRIPKVLFSENRLPNKRRSKKKIQRRNKVNAEVLLHPS